MISYLCTGRSTPGKSESLIPKAAGLETYDGNAWIGIIPFRMSGVRLRWTPGIPGLSSFPELNVRNLRRYGWQAWRVVFSVWKPPMSWLWRWRGDGFICHIFEARMSLHPERQHDRIQESSNPRPRAREAGISRQLSSRGPDARRAQPGSIEHFLTERYCLYAESRGRIFRGEIDHRPWNLQAASAEIGLNTVAASHGIRLPDTKPLLHFAQLQDVKIWPIRSAKEQGTSQSG